VKRKGLGDAVGTEILCGVYPEYNRRAQDKFWIADFRLEEKT
jgi:hypothetical protein